MNCNDENNKQQSYSKKLILNFFFDSDKKILCKKSQKKTNFKNVSFKNKSEVNKKFSKLRSVNLEKTVSFSKKVIQIEKNSPSKKLISTKLKKAKEHIKTPYRDNFKKVIKSIDNLKSVELFKKEKTAIKFNKNHLIDNIYSERKKGNENILNISSRSI